MSLFSNNLLKDVRHSLVCKPTFLQPRLLRLTKLVEDVPCK